MAENKTKPTEASVTEFLDSIRDGQRKEDCYRLTAIMKELSGAEPKMWGGSIVGFGDYRYKYASGRQGDWFLCGFSPRKQSLSIYLMGYLENYGEILKDLGKHRHGKGCLYINKLSEIDEDVLRKLITTTIKRLESAE